MLADAAGRSELVNGSAPSQIGPQQCDSRSTILVSEAEEASSNKHTFALRRVRKGDMVEMILNFAFFMDFYYF